MNLDILYSSGEKNFYLMFLKFCKKKDFQSIWNLSQSWTIFIGFENFPDILNFHCWTPIYNTLLKIGSRLVCIMNLIEILSKLHEGFCQL